MGTIPFVQRRNIQHYSGKVSLLFGSDIHSYFGVSNGINLDVISIPDKLCLRLIKSQENISLTYRLTSLKRSVLSQYLHKQTKHVV